MSRFRRYILPVTVLLLALAGTAQAQSSRLYFAGYMGLTKYPDLDFSDNDTPSSGSFEAKNAGTFAGALGLRLSPQWRVEAEGSYRRADLDRIEFANGGSFKLGGDMKTWLFMLNMYYDFDLEWDYLFPYLSVGLGVARHQNDVDDVSGFAADASGDSLNLAWQLGGGLKYRLNDDLAFTGGYRWLGSTDPEIGGYEHDFGGHEIRIGLEYDLPFAKK